MAGRVVRRVVAPTGATAVVSSAVAIAVNLATEWKSNVWAWLVVSALTALSGGVALWLEHRRADQIPESSVETMGPVVRDSVIGRDNVQVGRAGRDVAIHDDR